MRQKVSKFAAVVGLVLAFSILSRAGDVNQWSAQCTDIVSDTQNILGTGTADVNKAATLLVDQGAEVHLITTSAASSSLEEQVVLLKTHCLNWQSPNGGVKANMLVFMVAPKERRMAIFYGPAYAGALDGQTDRIKRDFMGPRFKGGDWAGGLIAGAVQVSSRIKASIDESNKPVTNQTVNEATDLHGLWVSFWIVGGVLLGALVLLVYYGLRRRKDDVQKAQQNAIAARSRAVNLIDDVEQGLAVYPDMAKAPPAVLRASAILDVVSRELSRLGNSESGDPTAEGMELSFYDSLYDTYNRLAAKLELAKSYLSNPHDNVSSSLSSATPEAPEPPIVPTSSSSPTPSPAPAQTTVVVKEGGNNDLLTGVLLGEAIREPEREPEPEPVHHHHHHSDDSSSSSSSSSDDSSSSSFGGSSSSWSDSGSSWSDSGSSSSFGGDSGGGFGGDSSGF